MTMIWLFWNEHRETETLLRNVSEQSGWNLGKGFMMWLSCNSHAEDVKLVVLQTNESGELHIVLECLSLCSTLMEPISSVYPRFQSKTGCGWDREKDGIIWSSLICFNKNMIYSFRNKYFLEQIWICGELGGEQLFCMIGYIVSYFI